MDIGEYQRLSAETDVLDPDDLGLPLLGLTGEVGNLAAEYKKRRRNSWRDAAKAVGAIDAETFADLYTVLVEGTLILRQVHGRNDAAQVARKLASALLDQYIPAAAS